MGKAVEGKLVHAIYESAADGSWADAMQRVASRFGAHSALIYSCDKSSRLLFQDSVEQFGFDPAMLAEYSRYYIHRNVWADNEKRMAEGAAVTSSMLYPDDQLKKTEYYCNWLRRQDIFYGIGGMVSNVDGVVTKLTFVCPERRGSFNRDDVRLMGGLMPHFRAASQIRSRVQRSRAMAANALAALEYAPFGTVLVNRDAGVVHMTKKALPLVGKDGPLVIERQGRLAARSAADTASLRRSIMAASLLREGRTHWRSEALVLSMTGGASLSVTAAPLDAAADVRVHLGPWVAVFLDVRARRSDDALREQFGLTPAEAELAKLIASGARAKEIAVRRGVSINTVRTQLASCMHKLNVHRQADLVRVVAAVEGGARAAHSFE